MIGKETFFAFFFTPFYTFFRSVFIHQSPPVWADIDVSYIPIMKAVSTYGDRTYSKATECVNVLAQALNVSQFSYIALIVLLPLKE